MAIIVGSARIDERGKATGGQVGDQTGKEVSTQNFYVHAKGWYVLRAKDANYANKIAEAMKIACANDNIGYDQTGRYGVITNGINSKVKTEADCSSLVRACIKYATGKDVGDFRTTNQVSVLEKSGLFENHISYTNDTKLYNGDILVTKTQGHTVVVVSGANERTKPAPQPTPVTKGRVAKLQEALNQAGARLAVDNSYGPLTKSAVNKYWNSKPVIKWVQQTLNERGYGKLAIDGSRGPLTRSATKSFQKAKKLVQDGSAGPTTILYMATK